MACQKLTEERERGQRELGEAVKLLKVCFFKHFLFYSCITNVGWKHRYFKLNKVRW